MKQSLCATAKREKSRRRGTLPCGKLPENKESAPEGAPIAPQTVKTSRRVCARRRKCSLNHFCRRPVRRRKSFSARKRASASECAAASRDLLKWESPAGLSHLNIKKAHPKVRPLRNAVGVRLEPARLGRWVAARSLPRFQRPAKSREACNSRPEIGVPYI